MAERGATGREGPPGREGAPGRHGSGEQGEKGEPGQDAAELLPWRVKMAFLALALVSTLTLAALGLVVSQNRDLAKEGAQAHDVLCVERQNQLLRKQRADTLLSQQSGPTIDYFGLSFPRDEIIRTQLQLESSLKASEALNCVPPPEPTVSNPPQTTIR